MGAHEPFPNAPADITEWLPLLGSIVRALCGGGGETASRSDEEIG